MFAINKRKAVDARKAASVKTKKLYFLAVIFCGVFTVLFCRVLYIKASYGAEYERRAIENKANKEMSVTTLKASRGSIYDRDRQSMAISYAVNDVILDVREFVKIDLRIKEKERETGKKSVDETGRTSVERTIDALSDFLNIPKEELEKYLETDENGKPVYDTNYKILAKELDKSVTSELMKAKPVCVYTEEKTKRFYPHGALASQVLGFIRGDASLGLEKRYDEQLSGKDGRSARVGYGAEEERSAVNGYSLVTTIDSSIQQYVEKAVAESDETFPAENTSIIVMNPKTGEILAMAQHPSFNNNEPTNLTSITDAEVAAAFENLTDDETYERLNRIWSNFHITRSFEPGSIYKPFGVAAALEEGVTSISSGFYCGGSDPVTGINCHKIHGDQTLTQVLMNSCNVGVMAIGRSLGPELFYKYHKDFGFGMLTGVDLPGEADFASLQYTREQLDNSFQLATSTFGQGFNVTPIQIITAFSALINGGNLMKPYVVSQALDEAGNVIEENKPIVTRKVISRETSDIMRTALLSVVTPDGTGWKAVIDGYRLGGKTGTAQQGERHEEIAEDEFTMSFMAYMPASDPEIIALAVIDHPVSKDDGVTTPAYMIKKLFTDIIKYKAYPPDAEMSEGGARPESDGVTLGNLTGRSVMEATQYLGGLGVEYEIIGGGNVISGHMPAEGASVGQGDKVFLYARYEGADEAGALALVPDVRGTSADEASGILSRAGFKPVLTGDGIEDFYLSEGGSNYKTFEVIDQMPAYGVKLPLGTEIRLKIASSEE
ncbi:MAG: PASTA domain-containing protein [Clostridiales bacterium]|nr:PASTA domain-containing protein [Clostridiales bacterium]